MARSEKDNSPLADCDWTKSREVNAPISIKDFMVKELTSSLEDGDMHELSVRTDPTRQDSTRVKQRIRILDHTKNLI